MCSTGQVYDYIFIEINKASMNICHVIKSDKNTTGVKKRKLFTSNKSIFLWSQFGVTLRHFIFS